MRTSLSGESQKPLELQADQAADLFMSGRSAAALFGGPRISAQGEGGSRIQRKSLTPTPQRPLSIGAERVINQVSAGSARPLPPSVRAPYEQSFGHDFSNVQIHTDDSAAASARSLNARAYALGNHLVFGHNAYAPHSLSGQRLIAHELTHTLQPASGIMRKVDVTALEVDETSLLAEVTSGLSFVFSDNASLYASPDPSAQVLDVLRGGQKVHKTADPAEAHGWAKCHMLSNNGQPLEGFFKQTDLRDPPVELIKKDPAMKLIKVQSGQTFWDLVKAEYGVQGNESTADQNINHFINAIRNVNKPEAFTVKKSTRLEEWSRDLIPGRDASATELIADVRLWIPSYLRASEMDVGSGTVTGEIARANIGGQKLKDFTSAVLMSRKYVQNAVTEFASQFGQGLLQGLLDFALKSAAIVGTTTATGALLGSLLGGVGAVPGAEIGFEIGLFVLKYYGMSEAILGLGRTLLDLMVRLADAVKIAWLAGGKVKQIQASAERFGLVFVELGAALIALAAKHLGVDRLADKSLKAIKESRFVKVVGETNLAKYAQNRARMTTTKSMLNTQEHRSSKSLPKKHIDESAGGEFIDAQPYSSPSESHSLSTKDDVGSNGDQASISNAPEKLTEVHLLYDKVKDEHVYMGGVRLTRSQLESRPTQATYKKPVTTKASKRTHRNNRIDFRKQVDAALALEGETNDKFILELRGEKRVGLSKNQQASRAAGQKGMDELLEQVGIEHRSGNVGKRSARERKGHLMPVNNYVEVRVGNKAVPMEQKQVRDYLSRGILTKDRVGKRLDHGFRPGDILPDWY